jgi:hypothetical protein
MNRSSVRRSTYSLPCSTQIVSIVQTSSFAREPAEVVDPARRPGRAAHEVDLALCAAQDAHRIVLLVVVQVGNLERGAQAAEVLCGGVGGVERARVAVAVGIRRQRIALEGDAAGNVLPVPLDRLRLRRACQETA